MKKLKKSPVIALVLKPQAPKNGTRLELRTLRSDFGKASADRRYLLFTSPLQGTLPRELFRGHVRSLKSLGIGRPIHIEESAPEKWVPTLPERRIVVSPTNNAGANGGWVFHEVSSPRKRKKKAALRSGPALRSRYQKRHAQIQRTGRRLATALQD